MNIVLVVLDSVRHDVFEDRAQTLKGMADSSFQSAITPSSWTLPAHGSMLTGRLPSQHDAHAGTRQFDVDSTFLDELDIHLTASSANLTLNTKPGFTGIFDSYESVYFPRNKLLPGGLNVDEFVAESDGTPSTFLKEAWGNEFGRSILNGLYAKTDGDVPLQRRADFGTRSVLDSFSFDEEPFFGYVNIMESHLPHENTSLYDTSAPGNWSSKEVGHWEYYESPELYSSYIENFRNVYAATVEYIDEILPEFIRSVQAETDEETVFIITSDHGDYLGYEGEDWMVGHSMTTITSDILRVPLYIVNGPEQGQITRPFSLSSLSELVSALQSGDDLASLTSESVLAERCGVSNPDSVPDKEVLREPMRLVFNGDSYESWQSECEYDARFDVPISQADVDDSYGAEVSDEVEQQLKDLGYT